MDDETRQLRDYFAAHAPFTITDAIRVAGKHQGEEISDVNKRKIILTVLAQMNYEYADLMLAQGAK